MKEANIEGKEREEVKNGELRVTWSRWGWKILLKADIN
jgi:hypothetical protein